jgi:hypothetical protein
MVKPAICFFDRQAEHVLRRDTAILGCSSHHSPPLMKLDGTPMLKPGVALDDRADAPTPGP